MSNIRYILIITGLPASGKDTVRANLIKLLSNSGAILLKRATTRQPYDYETEQTTISISINEIKKSEKYFGHFIKNNNTTYAYPLDDLFHWINTENKRVLIIVHSDINGFVNFTFDLSNIIYKYSKKKFRIINIYIECEPDECRQRLLKRNLSKAKLSCKYRDINTDIITIEKLYKEGYFTIKINNGKNTDPFENSREIIKHLSL